MTASWLGSRNLEKPTLFRTEKILRLYPLEIKKTASSDKRLVRIFGVIDKCPLQLGTGAVLCMADRLSAFDRENLIVPVWMI